MPRVSIITAAYNHVGFIRQAIESVQGQTYRDFEHIVIDDGSSDGTADVLKSFGDQITYLRQENRGTQATINRAIRMSSGEFIAILDSDDAWLPNKLELQMQAFEHNPEAGLVYSQAYDMDAEGNLLHNGPPQGTPFDDPGLAFEELLQQNRIPVLTTVFRRACINDVGYFDEHFKSSSDWDMWIRIAARWPIIFVPQVLALYRFHAGNSWAALVGNGRAYKERLLILEKTASALSETTTEAAKRKQFVNAVFRSTALKTTYGFWYRYQYSKALRSMLFALRLQPGLLKEALFAVRLRFIAKLMVGERGTKILQGMKRLLT